MKNISTILKSFSKKFVIEVENDSTLSDSPEIDRLVMMSQDGDEWNAETIEQFIDTKVNELLDEMVVEEKKFIGDKGFMGITEQEIGFNQLARENNERIKKMRL